jgi:hypothetical protein
MTTLMGYNLATVYPNPSVIVHCAKVQDRSPRAGSGLKVSLIPADPVKAAVTDAAGRGLRRKRHLNCEWPFLNFRRMPEFFVIVEAESPRSV